MRRLDMWHPFQRTKAPSTKPQTEEAASSGTRSRGRAFGASIIGIWLRPSVTGPRATNSIPAHSPVSSQSSALVYFSSSSPWRRAARLSKLRDREPGGGTTDYTDCTDGKRREDSHAEEAEGSRGSRGDQEDGTADERGPVRRSLGEGGWEGEAPFGSAQGRPAEPRAEGERGGHEWPRIGTNAEEEQRSVEPLSLATHQGVPRLACPAVREGASLVGHGWASQPWHNSTTPSPCGHRAHVV